MNLSKEKSCAEGVEIFTLLWGRFLKLGFKQKYLIIKFCQFSKFKKSAPQQRRYWSYEVIKFLFRSNKI